MPALNELSAAPSGETCPACRGEGDTSHAAERLVDGVWARDARTCYLCLGVGEVSAELAQEYRDA